jgi:hypothetical protein
MRKLAMRNSVRSQAKLFALAMLLGMSDCNTEPIVVLGRAPTTKPADAGTDAAAGNGGTDVAAGNGGTRERTEHRCGVRT